MSASGQLLVVALVFSTCVVLDGVLHLLGAAVLAVARSRTTG